MTSQICICGHGLDGHYPKRTSGRKCEYRVDTGKRRKDRSIIFKDCKCEKFQSRGSMSTKPERSVHLSQRTDSGDVAHSSVEGQKDKTPDTFHKFTMYSVECKKDIRDDLSDILGKEIKCSLTWDKWNDALLIEVFK